MALLKNYPSRPRLFARAEIFRRGRLALVWLAAFALAAAAPAQTSSTREYQVKAVFLFNFAQFVDWPPAAFSDPQSPLVIGVLGKDPFDGALDDAVRGETVNARPLEVRRFKSVEEIRDCHVLFISGSESAHLDRILGALKGRNILTVGDTDGFAERGGMIRFVIEKNKVRFRINLDSAKAAGLTISSKLLRPAEIVTSGKV
jgi:hypothetical protein